MNTSTHKCPSCGAQATNQKNCEFCGSFLVQFAAAGIAGKTGELSMQSTFVFPGLLEALKFNVRTQALNPDCTPITDIIVKNDHASEFYTDDDIVLQVADNEFYSDKVDPVGLAIDMPLNSGDPRIEKFVDSDFFSLFKIKRQEGYIDDSSTFAERLLESYGLDEIADQKRASRLNAIPSEMVCYLNFGKDVEGAARFISRLLTETFGIDSNVQLQFSTFDPDIGVLPNGGLKKMVEESTADSDFEFDPQQIGKWIFIAVIAYVALKIIF